METELTNVWNGSPRTSVKAHKIRWLFGTAEAVALRTAFTLQASFYCGVG